MAHSCLDSHLQRIVYFKKIKKKSWFRLAELKGRFVEPCLPVRLLCLISSLPQMLLLSLLL